MFIRDKCESIGFHNYSNGQITSSISAILGYITFTSKPIILIGRKWIGSRRRGKLEACGWGFDADEERERAARCPIAVTSATARIDPPHIRARARLTERPDRRYRTRRSGRSRLGLGSRVRFFLFYTERRNWCNANPAAYLEGRSAIPSTDGLSRSAFCFYLGRREFLMLVNSNTEYSTVLTVHVFTLLSKHIDGASQIQNTTVFSHKILIISIFVFEWDFAISLLKEMYCVYLC